MTDDAKLIERLRAACRGGAGCKCTLHDAAARLTALIAENERLRAAIRQADALLYEHGFLIEGETRRVLRAALSGDEGGRG